MSENRTAAIDVVRGEMQPWSDDIDQDGAVNGPALRALVDDVATGSNGLVAGPHSVELIEAVAAKVASLTVLVRSVSDAEVLSKRLPEQVRVVAGALDGLADATPPGTYDVLIAADGLDRVLGADSADLDWSERLGLLARVAAPGAVVVLGLENEFSLTGLLDRRPPDQRHGDEEWRPIHDDPSRPVSMHRFAAALQAAGLTAERTYAAFTTGHTVELLVDGDAAAETTPGRLPARLAGHALAASAIAVPLLAPVEDSADAAARAGLLGSVAPGWLAVCGASGRTLYRRMPGHDTVLTADLDGETAWRIETRPGVAETDSSAVVRFMAEAVSPSVPDTVSVETTLINLAAAEDIPAFRDLAAGLGDWVRAQGERRLQLWDDVVVGADGFAGGTAGWVPVRSATAPELLAAAWHRFHDRLIGRHRRHPWPPWMVGEDLVTAWLGMSGVEASPAISARGRELADAVAAADGTRTTESPEPDLRTALADAERARTEAFELAGHIAGLERTLAYRDKQLAVREGRLRTLRTERNKAVGQLKLDRGSRSYKLARQMSRATVLVRPRRLAGAVKRRIKRRLNR